MTTKKSSTNKNIRIAKVLMWLVTASALFAGIGSIMNVTTAPGDIVVSELWRVFGLFTFSALFAILALNPQSNKLLWVVVIINKLALGIAGLVFMSNPSIVGASDLAIFDSGLVFLLIISSILAGIWKK
jgi:hypothetical protein